MNKIIEIDGEARIHVIDYRQLIAKVRHVGLQAEGNRSDIRRTGRVDR
ncbi:hypothetical protein [Variovorax sp. CY25R-8]|nr:hypothetical protein [Variovorax sp. CY25R-8]MCT8181056.1 hypothetical protein [Variovorax sp. CY25R-8]